MAEDISTGSHPGQPVSSLSASSEQQQQQPQQPAAAVKPSNNAETSSSEEKTASHLLPLTSESNDATPSSVAIKAESTDAMAQKVDGDSSTEKATEPSHNTEQKPPPSITQTSTSASNSQIVTKSETSQQPTSTSARMDSSNEDTVMTDPVVYGTRSRNRNAGHRPNYAEDQDMDFEYTTATSTSESKRNADKRVSDANDSKSRVVNGDATTPKTNATPATNPAIPAPSSSNTTNSKKRKAATTSTNTTSATTAPSAAISNTMSSTAASLARKSAHTGTPPPRRPETNMCFFDKTKARLNKQGQLVADDGTIFNVDDHVYLICEPPGEPYYLCRIMEFLHSKSDDPTSHIDSLRVNWFYRPRDVQRYNNDTRLVYGTMHSDICPLTSLRGKCQINHRSDIEDLDQYRKNPDHFWFNQIVDRFIKRFYEVIPTSQVINVPDKVKKALDERWKYIAVEASRVKELTSAVKLCKRCTQYCASNDSVECAMCGKCYHLNCVRPPLPKKPSRGFAWACGPCSRAQEKRLEARHTPQVGASGEEFDEEIFEEEEEDPNIGDSTRAPSPDSDASESRPLNEAELALANMWPMRYLGIHCRVEDALQYDDRAIYPRASSRLGMRHQANVEVYPGRPLTLVKPTEIKKKYVKNNSHKKDGKLSKETLAAIEADRAEKAKRPPWIQDEPAGYVARGEDYDNDDPRNTATLLFKMPNEDQEHSAAANEAFVNNYVEKTMALSRQLKVSDFSVNLLDRSLAILIEEKYDMDEALKRVAKLDRGPDLKEPIFTHEDLRKFEEGVSKYGSEHRLIKQHMKTTLPMSAIIRFYYLWKKTPRGSHVWGNYGGRQPSKKKAQQQQQIIDEATKLQQELADNADDSAFDNGKALAHKKEFQCKFCNKRHSSQWRRAPGVAAGQTAAPEKGSKDKGNKPLLALCIRCARLWRKYAIQWEEQDEVARKVAQGGGKSWKRRIDEELLKELQIESNMGSREASDADNMTPDPSLEPAKKKSKTADAAAAAAAKAKPVPVKQPTPPPPPIIPDPPKWRELPCVVCATIESVQGLPLTCAHCKLTVHKHCYGIADEKIGSKWVCDQCTNDRTPVVSTDYACTLCPIEFTPHELWEGPKVSHKKKTDRDREKERMEKELLEKAKNDYIKRQQELSRPLQPREPLKKTDGNNWVHVSCAIWTPEIKFSNAAKLERAEGFSTIAPTKYETMCKLCKNARQGACVSCLQCHSNFHVACAFEAGYTFGFDVTPVKGSRKDQVTIVTLGQETGYLTAGIWCRDHSVKSIVHPMNEVVDEKGTTALQLYVENYKQADQTLTGTARKANLLSLSIKNQPQAGVTSGVGANRRVSTVNANNTSTTTATTRKSRNSVVGGIAPDDTESGSPTITREMTYPEQSDKKCIKCGIEVSPRWWPVSSAPTVPDGATTNGTLDKPHEANGISSEPQSSTAVECHKCHYKAITPPKRIPLSPKPLNINLEWPPCLSEPPRPQMFPDPSPFARPMDQQSMPSYHRPNEWQYNQHHSYPRPFSHGPPAHHHHQSHPGGPPPPPPGPQLNGGPHYGGPGHHGSPPPPGHAPAHGPAAVPHHQPFPQANGYYDRPPPRTGPAPPTLPPTSSFAPPPPPPGPTAHHHHHHVPPHHTPQATPSHPPPFSRSSGSPFTHTSPAMRQQSSPAAPHMMQAPGQPQPQAQGQPQPPVQAQGQPQAQAMQPSTPKPLEPRPGASNSPHIGNLLS